MSTSAIPDTHVMDVARLTAAVRIVELAATSAGNHGDSWTLKRYLDGFSQAYERVKATTAEPAGVGFK